MSNLNNDRLKEELYEEGEAMGLVGTELDEFVEFVFEARSI
tara:strand:- start:144 stop:266 length:123 start_codon:yes stop_codon:yes gene_type:complete